MILLFETLRSLAVLAGVTALVGLAGCHSPKSAGSLSRIPSGGAASVEIINEESSLTGSPELATESALEGIQIVPIAAFVHAPQVEPVYPPEALDGKAGSYVLYLTATFDPSGRLVDLQRSTHRVVLPHPFEEAFFAAGKAAIHQWQVEPAREVTWRIPANGRERQYVRTETVSTTVEIKFTFNVPGEVH